MTRTFLKIEEDDVRGVADGGVMAGKGQFAGFSIDAEDGDVVGALVAHITELACGVEVEAARVVAARPFVADEGQVPVPADREDPDAVVQTVAGIDESAIAGNHDLGTEITSGKPGR